MPIRVEREKWILFRHTCKYEVLKMLALKLKQNQANLSNSALIDVGRQLELINLYSSRNSIPNYYDTFQNKVKTLAFWMFGYKDKVDGVDKFIFSPLGNLFVKHIEDDEACKKIFLTMAYSMQYEHPNSDTPRSFSIYPFRLIFRLLCDARINKRLFDDEYTYLLPFIKTIDEQGYEELISKILEFRSLPIPEKRRLLEADEHTYVNSYYEWQFTEKLFEQVGLFDIVDLENVIAELYHPSNPGSHSKPTKRTVRQRYVKLCPELEEFLFKLLDSYSVFEKPVELNPESALREDAIKEVYSFYPNELLNEIGEYDDVMSQIMELPARIEEYANNEENGDCYLFEDVLTDAFNLFIDVEARKIGGAGKPDIECILLTLREKFDVEAKSTSNRLSGLYTNRLREHRQQINSKYTIVITPRYVPVVLRDISGEDIVIIKASTFKEYLYNNLVFNPRNMQFAEIDTIVRSNLGKDISALVSDLTFRKYA